MTPTIENSAERIPTVSKSRYLQGLQCAKLLWSAYNAKHLFPGTDDSQRAVFDEGKRVGDLAKQLFPGGIDIGGSIDEDDFDSVIIDTQQALEQRCPLYEAAFVYNGGFARVDVLNPVGNDEWDLIEVKSTTGVKDIHLPDLAFQLFLLTGAGLKIRRCVLGHVNSEFVRSGPIDPRQFFVMEDVTHQVAALSPNIEIKLRDMVKTIRLPQTPEIQIGGHCGTPYPCPLYDHCWSFLPEQNVMTLYRGGDKGFQLLANGVTSLKDIPDNFPLTSNQRIQRQTAVTGQPHTDKAAIKEFLSQLVYPVSYLDFETFAPAVPLFDGVRPYRPIPFQYSLHVVASPGAEPEHRRFLAESADDPRPEFMRRLREALPTTGSVVAYNAQFERSRLAECSESMPEFKPWVNDVKRRIVDLLVPFRGFRYHHPKQSGSASMKSVLPALTGEGYDHLEIQDGVTASLEFLRVTFGGVSAEERAAVRKRLDEYCGLDTLGMIRITDALRRLS